MARLYDFNEVLGAFRVVVMIAPGATDILIADNKEGDDLVVPRAGIEIYYTVLELGFLLQHLPKPATRDMMQMLTERRSAYTS